MDDDDFSPASNGNNQLQQRENQNHYLDDEEESMDMEADMGGITERNPMSARSGRDRHLQNGKRGAQQEEDGGYADPKEVKLNFNKK